MDGICILETENKDEEVSTRFLLKIFKKVCSLDTIIQYFGPKRELVAMVYVYVLCMCM